MSTYERIREKQTSRRNRILKRIMMLILLCLLVAGGYYALRQPQLSFGIVYVTGTEKLLREDILFLTGLKEPVNFFVLDKNQVEGTLKKDIRIKNASVSYEFPNIINIAIQEEQPLFYLASSYGYVSISSQKEVMSAGKSIKNADAPIVSGVAGKNVFVGDIINDIKIIHIFDFLDSLDSFSRLKISEVNVYDSTSIKVIDIAGRPYFLGDVKQIKEKAPVLCALVKELSEKNLAVEFVDLSYAKPYIKIKQQTKTLAMEEKR